MHGKRDLRRCLSAIALAVAASGCSILQPQPDPTRYYVLASLAQPAQRLDSDLRIGIAPLLVPDYLQRYEMAHRSSATELRYATHERWAESLSDGLGRTVAENIARLIGTKRVVVLPAPLREKLDFIVRLEVVHFEPDPDGAVNLVVRWAVRDAKRKSAVDDRLSQFRAQPATADWRSRSETMSRMALQLSEEIATAIRNFAASQ